MGIPKNVKKSNDNDNPVSESKNFKESVREISAWPEWKVLSMLDKDNDLDIRFYDAIKGVRVSG